MTAKQKIEYATQIRERCREEINKKGVAFEENTPFKDYPAKISEIQTVDTSNGTIHFYPLVYTTENKTYAVMRCSINIPDNYDVAGSIENIDGLASGTSSPHYKQGILSANSFVTDVTGGNNLNFEVGTSNYLCRDCVNLENLTIEGPIKIVGKDVFRTCPKLKTIKLTKATGAIRYETFALEPMNDLISVVMPEITGILSSSGSIMFNNRPNLDLTLCNFRSLSTINAGTLFTNEQLSNYSSSKPENGDLVVVDFPDIFKKGINGGISYGGSLIRDNTVVNKVYYGNASKIFANISSAYGYDDEFKKNTNLTDVYINYLGTVKPDSFILACSYMYSQNNNFKLHCSTEAQKQLFISTYSSAANYTVVDYVQ